MKFIQQWKMKIEEDKQQKLHSTRTYANRKSSKKKKTPTTAPTD